MMLLSREVEESVRFLQKRITSPPEVGVILGSGLDKIGAYIKKEFSISYKDIPNFCTSTVEGHENCLYSGKLSACTNGPERQVLILSGRAHYYEGFSPEVITFPIRVINALGVKRLLLTCSSGGIRDDLNRGDILFVEDHINLMGINPLRGFEGSLFIDMSHAYETQIYPKILKEADSLKLPLKKGVLAAVYGPSYETPAEIRMLKIIGADAVCMSTIPEVLMARYLGMKVVGLSLITNKASKVDGELKHREVLKAARERGDIFTSLLERVIAIL